MSRWRLCCLVLAATAWLAGCEGTLGPEDGPRGGQLLELYGLAEDPNATLELPRAPQSRSSVSAIYTARPVRLPPLSDAGRARPAGGTSVEGGWGIDGSRDEEPGLSETERESRSSKVQNDPPETPTRASGQTRSPQ